MERKARHVSEHFTDPGRAKVPADIPIGTEEDETAFERSRMTMSPQLSKFTLVAHITFSVGWIGAVAAFLVLSIAGLTSHYAEIVRSAYVSMNLLGLYIIVPLSIASLLTGLVQSLGTSWGLFRQYWTVVKFVLTIGSSFLLLMHQYMAIARAAQRVLSSPMGTMPDLGQTGKELLVKAGLAILVLLITTTLSIYKPWGLTAYGRRIMQRRRLAQNNIEATAAAGPEIADSQKMSVGLKALLVVTAVVVTALVILSHLSGHAAMHHGF